MIELGYMSLLRGRTERWELLIPVQSFFWKDGIKVSCKIYFKQLLMKVNDKRTQCNRATYSARN